MTLAMPKIESQAAENKVYKHGTIILSHITAPDPEPGRPPSVRRDPSLVHAQGDCVQTNKEVAMSAFLISKLQRGESLTEEQTAIVKKSLGKRALDEVNAKARLENAPTKPVHKRKRKRDRPRQSDVRGLRTAKVRQKHGRSSNTVKKRFGKGMQEGAVSSTASMLETGLLTAR